MDIHWHELQKHWVTEKYGNDLKLREVIKQAAFRLPWNVPTDSSKYERFLVVNKWRRQNCTFPFGVSLAAMIYIRRASVSFQMAIKMISRVPYPTCNAESIKHGKLLHSLQIYVRMLWIKIVESIKKHRNPHKHAIWTEKCKCFTSRGNEISSPSDLISCQGQTNLLESELYHYLQGLENRNILS